jgi:hypothetical protein
LTGVELHLAKLNRNLSEAPGCRGKTLPGLSCSLPHLMRQET